MAAFTAISNKVHCHCNSGIRRSMYREDLDKLFLNDAVEVNQVAYTRPAIAKAVPMIHCQCAR